MIQINRYYKPAFIFFALVAGILFFSSCSKKPKSAPMQMEVPVFTATVVQKTVPVQISAIGNVESLSTVSVKAQVGGELAGVHFKEGDFVEKGQLLFTIDPRPFEINLEQSKANLAKDLAQVRQARANLKKEFVQEKNAAIEQDRYAELFRQNLISKEQADQFRTNAEASAASVAGSRAALQTAREAVQIDIASVENAKLQLQYASIRAPFNGKTGSLQAHAGDLIKANDTSALVVINRVMPIYVTFSVPETELAKIRQYQTHHPLIVEAAIPNQPEKEEGTVSFMDNAVDLSTGTIRMKGLFKNEDKKLWPGQFVNVALRLAIQPNTLVVPSQAVQTGQQGTYVFVVKPDLTADMRLVQIGSEINGETVITRGLQAGEIVVTDGQLGLVPGVKVIIKQNSDIEPATHP